MLQNVIIFDKFYLVSYDDVRVQKQKTAVRSNSHCQRDYKIFRTYVI